MFQRSSGILPYIDLYYSFFAYVNPADTEGTCPLSNCGQYAYTDGTDTCDGTNVPPDDIFLVGGTTLINTFDGGINKEKTRSPDMF